MPVIEEPTSVFQLTTSHRGRPGSSIVDYEDSISTHYLTQRQTGFPVPLLPIFPFQLTTSHRGRLSSPRAPAPADIFQLTTSHRGRLQTAFVTVAPSVFQLTTSHRGRRRIQCKRTFTISISTHYLTQRQTKCSNFYNRIGFISTHYLTQRQTSWPFVNVFPATFQLTTSHRGRLLDHPHLPQRLYFNSLPHTEVDHVPVWFYKTKNVFQLTTSHRGRL